MSDQNCIKLSRTRAGACVPMADASPPRSQRTENSEEWLRGAESVR